LLSCVCRSVDQQWLQARAGRVDGGSEPRRAGSYDHDVSFSGFVSHFVREYSLFG
jgi:hypothetical protein